MNIRKIIAAIAGVSIILCSATALYIHFMRRAVTEFEEYARRYFELEQSAVRRLPIYDDFIDAEKERELRRHLQQDHIKAAQENGTGPVASDSEIEKFIQSGELVSIDTGEHTFHYFYNVKKKNRCLTPAAAEGLKELTARFQRNLRKRADLTPVKIAISSALRTAEYQKGLRGKNFNATEGSTHSFGTSFDIFYDEYYVSPPPFDGSSSLTRSFISVLNPRMGFMCGASIRRQLRSILTETLLEMQDEGRIFAILERRQRCYHVTVLKTR